MPMAENICNVSSCLCLISLVCDIINGFKKEHFLWLLECDSNEIVL